MKYFKQLKVKWSNKLIESVFGKACILCGSTHNIKIHHLRKVSDVRGKYLKGNPLTWSEFTSAFKRK